MSSSFPSGSSSSFGSGGASAMGGGVPASTSAGSSTGNIVVIGAGGQIGKATVTSLAARVGAHRIVVALPSITDAANAHFTSIGAKVIKGDLADPSSLRGVFTGASAVYLIAPGKEERTVLTLNGLNAIKEAGAPFTLVLSVPSAEVPTNLMGRQFSLIEQEARRSGLPYSIIRLPWFIDNLKDLGKAPIKASNKFSMPIRPSATFSAVAVHDAGEAAANILANPSSHVGKVYTLAGPAYSFADAADALTKNLGKKVDYEQVPYDVAEKQFLSMGVQAWEVNEFTEMLRAMDSGSYRFPESDLRKLLDREPLGIHAWVSLNKMHFM